MKKTRIIISLLLALGFFSISNSYTDRTVSMESFITIQEDEPLDGKH